MFFLQKELDSIKTSGARWIHLDVMDGCFVPNFFLSPKAIADIRKGTDLFLDAHLMIQDPKRYVQVFADAGSDSITFHFEAADRPLDLIDSIHRIGCKAGVAISPDTPLHELYPLLSAVDLILLMSIFPGRPGQRFMPDTYERLQTLATVRKENGYPFLISVDGAIDETIAPRLRVDGADVLVVGHAFFSATDRKRFVHNLFTM